MEAEGFDNVHSEEVNVSCLSVCQSSFMPVCLSLSLFLSSWYASNVLSILLKESSGCCFNTSTGSRGLDTVKWKFDKLDREINRSVCDLNSEW